MLRDAAALDPIGDHQPRRYRSAGCGNSGERTLMNALKRGPHRHKVSLRNQLFGYELYSGNAASTS